MTKRTLEWDNIPEETKKKCIDNIIAFAQDSWDLKIGIIAAQQIFDKIMEDAYSTIYNKGVVDAQKLLQDKMTDLNIDLESLIKK